MTSDRPSGDPAGADTADADDWWGGAVDPAPPPADPSADPPIGSTGSAGSDGNGDAVADRTGSGRSRWLLGAAAATVVVAVGVGVLVTRDDDGGGSDVATDGNGPGQGGPGGFGGGTVGTITDLDADALTLVVETESGDTVEVTATDDTTVSEMVEGSADDLAVGDDVLVVGSEADGGTIAAEQVVAGGGGMQFGGDRPDPGEGGFPGDGELPEGFDPGQGGGQPPEGFDPGQGPGQGGGPGGFTSGTIESIDDGSLSVRTADDETVTVTLSSSTTVSVSQELSFDDLATGDEITVTGQGWSDEGGTVEAVVIRRGDGGFPGGGGDAGDGATT